MDERRIFRARKSVRDACRLTAIPNCRKHGLFSPSTLKADSPSAFSEANPGSLEITPLACLDCAKYTSNHTVGLCRKSAVRGLNGLRPFKSSIPARTCSFGLFPWVALQHICQSSSELQNIPEAAPSSPSCSVSERLARYSTSAPKTQRWLLGVLCTGQGRLSKGSGSVSVRLRATSLES